MPVPVESLIVAMEDAKERMLYTGGGQEQDSSPGGWMARAREPGTGKSGKYSGPVKLPKSHGFIFVPPDPKGFEHRWPRTPPPPGYRLRRAASVMMRPQTAPGVISGASSIRLLGNSVTPPATPTRMRPSTSQASMPGTRSFSRFPSKAFPAPSTPDTKPVAAA